MASALKEFGGSRFAIRSAMSLARNLTPPAARRVIRLVTRLIAHEQSALYQAILTNQAQVRGLRPEDPTLPDAVRSVLRHAGQGYYDQFRSAALRQPPPVQMDDEARDNLLAGVREGRGVIAVGAHLSSFDLAIQHITASQKIRVELLALAQPTPGFQLLNELRANPYCSVLPVGPSALRTAIRHLRAGGLVGTGVDRPVPGTLMKLQFFDRPALLPTGHVRLALKTGALIAPLWCEWSQASGYRVRIKPPMEMERLADAEETIRYNARRVLAVFEPAIARRPEQWMMFLPIWPQAATAGELDE